VSEMLGDAEHGIGRLLKLEQDIVANLDRNICTLTNDERGHFALIVGYTPKPTPTAPTVFLFKVKRFGVFGGNKEQNERTEYIAVDLCHQRLVITMEPPEKKKANSVQHSFSPQMLEQIASDLIARFEDADQSKELSVGDLFGRVALQRMAAVMERAKSVEAVSNRLAKLTVFALIRLFDARKAMIDYVGYVETKISNAFHSVTGSEKEWKFPPQYDISENLQQIEASLQREMECIRRQEKLFEGYVMSYDGQPLGTVRWETYQRAGLKAALDDIIRAEDRIFEHLKMMRDKLRKYTLRQ